MKVLKVFKIQDTSTGLYSTGGYAPRWTDEGKAYKTLSQVKSALKLYERGKADYPYRSTQKEIAAAVKAAHKKVPSTWVVVEFELKPVRRTKAASLV